MFLTPMCLCSPSSTSWYRPKGGDALRLGSKGRYGLCVGGRLNCVIPLLHTAISERFRGAARDEALYKSTFTLLYFTRKLSSLS